jgi:hypothetical protein
MRLTIYDANPGKGFSQWFLKTSWLVGCWLQKRLGAVDEYYGATSWDDVFQWLLSLKQPIDSLQYWGHGCPGNVFLAGKTLDLKMFFQMIPQIHVSSVIWFRTCATFQGAQGQSFSRALADMLNCTVAGHTRIIGPVQGGLHTRRPQTDPSWPVTEAEPPKTWWPNHMKWGPNSVTCLATKLPAGW